MIVLLVKRIAGVRGKKRHRIVAPIIVELLLIHHTGALHLIKLKNRHELYRIDSKIFQIRNLLAQSLKGSSALDPGGSILGKTAHMGLIDDKILKRMLQLLDVAPVKIVFYHAGLIDKVVAALRPVPPFALSRNGSCIGVQNDVIRVKDLALGRIIRSVKLVRVFKLLDLKPKYKNRIGISNPVRIRNTDSGIRFRCHGFKQQQCTAVRAMGIDGKAHIIAGLIRSVHSEKARSDIIAVDVIQRI